VAHQIFEWDDCPDALKSRTQGDPGLMKSFTGTIEGTSVSEHTAGPAVLTASKQLRQIALSASVHPPLPQT